MILEQQNMQGNEVYQECDQQGKRVTGWPLREILRHTKDTSFRPRASPEGEVSVECKTKIQWETHPAEE